MNRIGGFEARAFAASEGENETLDPEAETRIDELWKPGSPIALVEFYPAVAREARTLIRESLGRSASPST